MRTRAALTLAELVVVLAILAAVSGLLVPLFTNTIHDANEIATVTSLVEIRDGMADYWSDIKHVTLDGVTTVATDAQRLQLDWLLANPVTGDTTFDFEPSTRIGWRGPYLAKSSGGLMALSPVSLKDAWNNQIEVHDVDSTATPRDVRIVSGGPDGVVSIPTGVATSALTANDIGDDIYVAIELR